MNFDFQDLMNQWDLMEQDTNIFTLTVMWQLPKFGLSL